MTILRVYVTATVDIHWTRLLLDVNINHRYQYIYIRTIRTVFFKNYIPYTNKQNTDMIIIYYTVHTRGKKLEEVSLFDDFTAIFYIIFKKK